jgi:hypothetical protein
MTKTPEVVIDNFLASLKEVLTILVPKPQSATFSEVVEDEPSDKLDWDTLSQIWVKEELASRPGGDWEWENKLKKDIARFNVSEEIGSQLWNPIPTDSESRLFLELQEDGVDEVTEYLQAAWMEPHPKWLIDGITEGLKTFYGLDSRIILSKDKPTYHENKNNPWYITYEWARADAQLASVASLYQEIFKVEGRSVGLWENLFTPENCADIVVQILQRKPYVLSVLAVPNDVSSTDELTLTPQELAIFGVPNGVETPEEQDVLGAK